MLSTPPAFILSQDQTLMFNLGRDQLWLFLTFFTAFWVSLLPSRFPLPVSGTVLFWNSFRIFRVALLFICQGSFTFPPLLAFQFRSGCLAFLSRNGCYLITSHCFRQALFQLFYFLVVTTSPAVEFHYSIRFYQKSTSFLKIFYLAKPSFSQGRKKGISIAQDSFFSEL